MVFVVPVFDTCFIFGMQKQRRIKRIVLLDEGKVAMVEIPVLGHGSDYQRVVYDRTDQKYALRAWVRYTDWELVTYSV